MTCPDANVLAAIETLRDEERAAIVDHAATCASCREILSDLLGVRSKGSFAEAETLASTSGPSLPIETGIPSMIDRYRVESRLGAGAMGVVYRGHDPELARPVAIKVLRSGGSPDRMKREAQALAQLQHPNVVAVYDVGEHEGSTFVTMALVDGQDLRTWLQKERTTAEILDAIAQAARGLEVAHAADIVHRDIKPDNIFVAKNGTVLVGDFGLARAAGAAGKEREAVDLNLLASDELTQTGTLVGTPAYMAPEQINGEVSAASDQFALCVTAWEALFGARPFTGKNLAELIASISNGPPAWPRTRSVPSHVRDAIRRGLAADPKARHPSMAAFASALAPPRRRWPFVAAGAVALVMAAGVAFALTRDVPPEKACDAIATPSYTIPKGPQATVATADRILGRYAKDWHDLASSSCRAAAKRELSAPAYAATKRCLEHRKDTLLWIVKQEDVLGLAEALEPIDTCRGLTDAATPPSAELEKLQRDLTRTTVLVQSKPESASGLDDLLARANTLDDASAIAEVQYLAAQSAIAHGLDPIESLQAAITAAERAHDDRIRTRASALLAIVTARAGRLSEALMHQKAATASAARAPDAVSTIAVERSAIELAYIQRDFDAQFAGYQRIETILIDRFGEPSRALVDVRFRHAGQLIRRNQPDGRRLLDLAVEGWKQLNADTPAVALESAIMAEPNPALKVKLQERVVELLRRNEPSELPKQLEDLALFYEMTADYERALQAMTESIELETPPPEMRLEVAAYYAFAIADRSDDAGIRGQRLAEALALLDRLPATAHERDSVQALRGRILLRAGRAEEATPLLASALEAAERKEPQEPFHIGVRSFALAQALWQIGDTRERQRAIALAEQASRRLPEARAALADLHAAAMLEQLDEQIARIEAWRRTHK